MELKRKVKKTIEEEAYYSMDTINSLKKINEKYKDIINEYKQKLNELVYLKELLDEIREFKIKLQLLDLTKENEFNAHIKLEEATKVVLRNDVSQTEVDYKVSELREFEFVESACFIKLIEFVESIDKRDQNKYDKESLEIINSNDYNLAISYIDQKTLTKEEQHIVDELYNKLNNQI